MVKYENHLGKIEITDKFFEDLVGSVVTECFGVVGMVQTNEQKFLFKKKDAIDSGVKVVVKENKLYIDVHISVLYGANISSIVKSIVHKVTYIVEETTDLAVAKVNVFVDEMKD